MKKIGQVLKKLSFWLLTLFTICVIVLIILTYVFSKNAEKSTILSIICAWVDFLAVTGIGIMVYFQTERFKHLDEENNKKNALVEKQKFDFNVFEYIMDHRIDFVNTISQKLNLFCENYNFDYFPTKLAYFEHDHNENFVNEITKFNSKLKNDYIDIYNMLLVDWRKSEENKNLSKVITEYYNKFDFLLNHIDFEDLKNYIVKVNNTLQDLYQKLLLAKNYYVVTLEIDLNAVLLNKNLGIEILRQNYSLIKETENGKDEDAK